MIPYPDVPVNKRLLWIHDSTMVCDLLVAKNTVNIQEYYLYLLVERYTLSKYPYAEQYIEWLFEINKSYSKFEGFDDLFELMTFFNIDSAGELPVEILDDRFEFGKSIFYKPKYEEYVITIPPRNYPIYLTAYTLGQIFEHGAKALDPIYKRNNITIGDGDLATNSFYYINYPSCNNFSYFPDERALLQSFNIDYIEKLQKTIKTIPPSSNELTMTIYASEYSGVLSKLENNEYLDYEDANFNIDTFLYKDRPSPNDLKLGGDFIKIDNATYDLSALERGNEKVAIIYAYPNNDRLGDNLANNNLMGLTDSVLDYMDSDELTRRIALNNWEKDILNLFGTEIINYKYNEDYEAPELNEDIIPSSLFLLFYSVYLRFYLTEEANINITDFEKIYIGASFLIMANANLMLQEIHACLGAGEFSYYEDDNGNLQPYFMNMARLLQRFARAYGVSFKADGSILQIRKRKNIKYDPKTGQVTIPDGWARGQFADNTQATTPSDGQPSTGITDDDEEERVGIAYQNRCNRYDNFDDTDPTNNTYLQGDIVLCENFLQLYESYLEDLDKGLNWQEMGTGILPSADGTGYCTYEGIGTLLAEAVYMISQLSSNIYQTHNLSLQNTAMNHQILKGLGLPLKLGSLEVVVGENDALGLGDNVKAYIPVPMLADDAVSLHKRLMDVIINLSLIISGLGEAKEKPPAP